MQFGGGQRGRTHTSRTHTSHARDSTCSSYRPCAARRAVRRAAQQASRAGAGPPATACHSKPLP
eukprot:737814-Prymnesium_polylepis.1